MKLVPNRFDVRVRKKFQKALNIEDKDIDEYLKKLPEEKEADYEHVTIEPPTGVTERIQARTAALKAAAVKPIALDPDEFDLITDTE